MTNMAVLIQGELQRMKRYNIFSGGAVVALLWVAVLYFLDASMTAAIFQTFLYVDITSMPILLVGVALFYERQEGSLKAILVSPVSKAGYLLSKLAALLVSSLFTLVLLYSFAYYFRDFRAQTLGLVAAVLIIATFHVLFGILLTFHSKNFTSLLMRVMLYMFVFLLPVLLSELGLISQPFLKNLLYIAPTKASMELLGSVTQTTLGSGFWYGLLYLTAAIGITFKLVLRGFAAFAEKEGGI